MEWFEVMQAAKAFRANLFARRRAIFDREFCPLNKKGRPIPYPAAVYYVTEADLNRAMAKAMEDLPPGAIGRRIRPISAPIPGQI